MERLRLLAAGRKAARALARRGVNLPPVLALTDPVRAPDPFALASGLPAGWGLVWRHFGGADAKTLRRLNRCCRLRRVSLFVSCPRPEPREGGGYWPEKTWRSARRASAERAVGIGSTHAPEGVRRAVRFGLGGVLISTVFPSGSPSAGRAMGAIRWIRLASGLGLRKGERPRMLYALGGVTASNAGRLSGFGGLAAVETFWRAFARPG